jgi:hypothetical protein
MDLPTAVEMDKGEAESLLDDYEGLRTKTAEDDAIIEALRAAAGGKPIINLRETIARGGVDLKGRPHLAVMWAHQHWAVLRREHSGTIEYGHRAYPSQHARTFEFPNLFERDDKASVYWSLRSAVPIIPPEHRPAKSNMSKRAVLWEVEEWEVVPRPSGDPALLKPLGNDLWVVEATWDLTPLEKLVLAGRGMF